MLNVSEVDAAPLTAFLHADLSDVHADEDCWLVVGGERIAMAPHTRTTLAQAAPHLPGGRNAVMTHYAQVPNGLPAHSVVRVHVKHSLKTKPGWTGEAGVSHSALYIPPRGEARAKLLAAGGVHHFAAIDYVSTAQTFLFHHPDLMSQDPDVAAIVMAYMTDDPAISAAINKLALLMRRMGPPAEGAGGWAELEPFTPDNGEQYKGDTTYYQQTPRDAVIQAALEPLAPLLVRVNNDMRLKDRKWSVQTGQSVVSQDGARQLALAATLEAGLDGGASWDAAVSVKSAVHGLKTSVSVVDRTSRKVKVTLENTLMRYLGAYVRFYDADGNAMSVPDWYAEDDSEAKSIDGGGLQYEDLRYLGLLSPVNSILGIPIVSDPGLQEVTFTFPPGAVKASIYGSGLGTGADLWPKTPVYGGVMTGVCNLGIPAFMLGFQVAAQSYKPLYDIVKDLSRNPAFVTLVAGSGAVYLGGTSMQEKSFNWKAFSKISQFIFSSAATRILVWVEIQIVGQKAAEQIPFAGWIMTAINIATGIAQMAQTIAAISSSPWNIENTIATTITTTITLHPDPRNKSFPQGRERSSVIKMIFKDQTRPTVTQTHAVADDSTALTLPAAFTGNTLGGKVRFEADFYIGTWLAGKATSGWIANDEDNATALDMYLVQYPVPLDKDSIYSHTQIMVYDQGAYRWQPSPQAPTATIADRNTAPAGNAIGDWTGLALSQRSGMLGLSWQAAGMGIIDCASGADGQLYAFQNVNIPGTPMDAVKFPSCGFTGPTRLVYDPYPPKFLMKDGQWVIVDGRPVADPDDVRLGEYYVDPRPAKIPAESGGGYHLRRVSLDPGTPLDMSAGQKSWGRFPYFPTSIAMHPSGLVVAVNADSKRLQVMTLATEAAADDQVPLAKTGAGPAQDSTRPGLLFHPVAVTCAYDGTILVLEDTKSSTGSTDTVIARLSAYDLWMSPVDRFFDDAGEPSPWLYLSNAADHYYLDLAAVGDEKMTYIYVLYYTGTGAQPSDYSMAIYTYGATKPDTNPLVVTPSIAAARLAVDMWHSAYTLNFAMVTDAAGKPAGPGDGGTGPAGRTVPSVSLWLPPIPTSA
ncbi:MAG TPA: hypothetical protein VGE72_19330 [Azospirillum sp.]